MSAWAFIVELQGLFGLYFVFPTLSTSLSVCTVFMQIYLILYLIQLPQLSGLSSPTWLTSFFPYCWIKFAKSDRKQLMAKKRKKRREKGERKGETETGRTNSLNWSLLYILSPQRWGWQSSPVSLPGESHGKIIPWIEEPGKLQSMEL